MKEPRHDDERLAALLEGRLEGQERDELLAYLANAGEDYQVFANSAAVLREIEEEEAAQARKADEQVSHSPAREVPPSVRPAWKPARRRPRALRWAVPTVLAGLVALVLYPRSGDDGPRSGAVQLAALLETAGQGVPADWTAYPWPGKRGASAGGSRTDGARAGAMLVDLSVAVQAGNADDTRRIVRDLQLFDEQGGAALGEIAARAGQPSDSLRPLVQQAQERLEGLYERDFVRLGAWAQAGRLAARRRDAAYFATGDVRGMLEPAERLTREDAPAQRALSAVRATLPAEGAPRWDALETAFRDLLVALAT